MNINLWRCGITNKSRPEYIYLLIALFLIITCYACNPGQSNPSVALNTFSQPAPSPELPCADFTCTALQGEAPLSTIFIRIESGEISSVLWDFGDGRTSKLDQPSHVYSAPGKYSVSLEVAGPGGKSRETKVDYITVFEKKAPPVPNTPDTPIASPTPKANETPAYISWKDASKYIGQSKTVEGTVVSAYYASSSNGKPTFLDFNNPYQGYFICLIWGTERDKFIKAFPPNPETYFLNKHVLITGLIEEYPAGSKNPEIVLTDVTQIKIIN